MKTSKASEEVSKIGVGVHNLSFSYVLEVKKTTTSSELGAVDCVNFDYLTILDPFYSQNFGGC